MRNDDARGCCWGMNGIMRFELGKDVLLGSCINTSWFEFYHFSSVISLSLSLSLSLDTH